MSHILHIIAAETRGLSAVDGIHLTLESDKHLRIRGVPGELYSAFANLVTNAVRYSPEGGNDRGALVPTARTAHDLKFRDHGMGIAPEHLTRLTERFYRIDLCALAGARWNRAWTGDRQARAAPPWFRARRGE